MLARTLHLLLVAHLVAHAFAAQCGGFHDNERVDCFPEPGASQQQCEARGCCWQPTAATIAPRVPFCFFPSDAPSYNVDVLNQNDSRTVALLSRSAPSGWPNDIPKLRVTVTEQGGGRLRFRIEDNSRERWEPPLELGPAGKVTSDFKVTLRRRPFGLTVQRRFRGQILFDSASMAAPLIFADQFLQISTRLATTNVYGIGEQRRNFTHDLRTGWERIALWTRDEAPTPKLNLYGVHNFMLGLFPDGSAYGLFLLNSNAQEVMTQPTPALTYRTIGGILDFFVFNGPSPSDVIQQYYSLIGHPMMPPYWALGFQLSRWGYGSLDVVKKTLQRNLAANIPLDVQWNDIDYMSKYRDWTYDQTSYKGLPDFIAQLHAKNMRYVIIIDPGISSQYPGQYPPYDDGLAKGVFIMKADGSGPIIGNVWPGDTAYPDFTATATSDWWCKLASDFHKTVPYDGLWIDMNEPSSFVAGSKEGCPGGSPLDNPPYIPGVLDHSLQAKTICPSAKQNLSTHYNLHSMYGYFEAKVTNPILQRILPGKRVFLLTRSSFAGSGRYTFHWTGDNSAKWEDMYYSIGQILNFNMFGIPMVGADVCGFIGNTTEELCVRWMQLGAFYPFMRNHNTLGAREQDPAVWSGPAQAAMRSALQLRYSLLPYLYTQLFYATSNGTAVARPLFFEFSKEPATAGIDRQFLLGPALLVSPVLEPGATAVNAYLPKGRWCDIVTGASVRGQGAFKQLPAPLERINAHLRAGSIVPAKPDPVANTAAQRGQPYQLRACLDDQGRAEGALYADDGDSPLDTGASSHIVFAAAISQLWTRPFTSGFGGLSLGSLWVSGIQHGAPTNVTVNGKLAKFTYDTQNALLRVQGLSESLLKPVLVKWA